VGGKVEELPAPLYLRTFWRSTTALIIIIIIITMEERICGKDEF